MSANLAPTTQKDRIEVLDILRGYALFAILIGNLQTIRVPYFTPGYVLPTFDGIDELARVFMYNTLGTELYLVFSFLFGLGFAVQISRAEAKGVTGKSLYIRRMLGLFIIGCLHYILVWDGDILRVYAIFGVVLLFLNKLPNRALWIGALVLMLASPFVTKVMEQVDFFSTAPSGDVLAQIRDVYNNGSYPEVVAYRIGNFLPDLWAYLTFDGLNIMAMFMLGMYAGRRKIFENLDTYRNLFVAGLVGGAVASLAGYFTGIDIIHRPGMALIHVCGVTLLAMIPWFAQKLSILIPFGRMSFTNYLTQSIIATTIFYGYGFGQFEKIGPAGGLLLSVVIGVVQVIFSYFWMKSFNFGPFEWLWRSLSYGKFQPMRKTDDSPAAASSPI